MRRAGWKRMRVSRGRGDSWIEWHRGPTVIVEQLGNREGLRVSELDGSPVYELLVNGTWKSDHATVRAAMDAADARA